MFSLVHSITVRRGAHRGASPWGGSAIFDKNTNNVRWIQLRVYYNYQIDSMLELYPIYSILVLYLLICTICVYSLRLNMFIGVGSVYIHRPLCLSRWDICTKYWYKAYQGTCVYFGEHNLCILLINYYCQQKNEPSIILNNPPSPSISIYLSFYHIINSNISIFLSLSLSLSLSIYIYIYISNSFIHSFILPLLLQVFQFQLYSLTSVPPHQQKVSIPLLNFHIFIS